jgi:hypothetical protein
MIYNAIQNRAEVSLVDHRFILATILQEVCTLTLRTPSLFADAHFRPTAAPKSR